VSSAVDRMVGLTLANMKADPAFAALMMQPDVEADLGRALESFFEEARAYLIRARGPS
jgi:hypothetical protein